MNIKLESPVNRYYVQTLGMIFFPGEHFGESEAENADAPSLYVRTRESDTEIVAYAEAAYNDKRSSSEYTAEFSDIRSKERTLSLPWEELS